MERNILIRGTGIYTPKNEVDNSYFKEHFRSIGVEVKGLMNHLNRKKRFLADRDESSLSMGYESVKNVLEKTNTRAEEIDMIVFTTDTPEYNMPTNALKISNMIGAKNAHRVYDLNCNCIGMLVGIDTATCYMQQRKDIKKALVIGSMHISSVVKYKDPVVYFSFGDASASIILESVEEEQKRGIIDSEYFTDTNYHNSIVLPECGHSKELLYEVPKENRRMAWNPFDFGFLSDNWTMIIRNVLKRNNVNIDEVNHFVFSQFSDADNLLTLEKLGVSTDKYIFVGDKYGYTGTSSPIMALNEIWSDIETKEKDGYIVFCSVAAGYSMNAVLYKI